MKKTYTLLLAGLMVTGLAGCAGSPDSQQLSQKTVEYGCGPGGEQALSVQYTFRGEEALSARVLHLNQVVDMARVTSGNADMVGNTFRGGGYTWVTGKFDRRNVDDVDGQMLTQDAPAGVMQGGMQGGMHGGMHGNVQGGGYGAGAPAGIAGSTGVGNVILRDCRAS